MLRLFTPEQLDGDCHRPPDSHFYGKKGVYSFPCKVYCTTFFVGGQGEISKTGKSLISMLDDLEGNDFDMLGLDEFKTLLGGK